MKLIDPQKSETRDAIKKLEPLAREAVLLLERQKLLISQAQELMKKGGCPAELMDQNPFNFAVDLLTSYGKLMLELEE